MTLDIINLRDGGFNSPDVLTLYATDSTPGSTTITFQKPILLEDRDYLRNSVSNLTFNTGGCHGDATVGVELR
jgi:hypothetical protein